MTFDDLGLRFFLVVALLMATIRLVNLAAARLRQPPVIAEMIAGILLGPSLLGLLFPAAQAWLFPQEVKNVVFILAQLGVIFYMFCTGLGFDVGQVRRNLRGSLAIALAGVAVPFALGAALAVFLRRDPTYFSSVTSAGQASLFVGAAFSVTAFPMLARILQESGMTGSKLGTLTLAAGALGDLAAWILLAVVVASFSGDRSIAYRAVGGGLLYVAILLIAVRPLLRRFGEAADRQGGVSRPTLTLIFLILMLCALFTEYVRIYAVFGAFLLGVVMPRGRMSRDLQRMIEPVASSFLIPFFFVSSGLNTQLALVTPATYAVGALVVALAVVGKVAGGWAAARLTGQDRRHAAAIGALMNARGLMDLILLNIGLQEGIITPTLFAILVTMTILTTLMATPHFLFVFRRAGLQAAEAPTAAIADAVD